MPAEDILSQLIGAESLLMLELMRDGGSAEIFQKRPVDECIALGPEETEDEISPAQLIDKLARRSMRLLQPEFVFQILSKNSFEIFAGDDVAGQAFRRRLHEIGNGTKHLGL